MSLELHDLTKQPGSTHKQSPLNTALSYENNTYTRHACAMYTRYACTRGMHVRFFCQVSLRGAVSGKLHWERLPSFIAQFFDPFLALIETKEKIL